MYRKRPDRRSPVSGKMDKAKGRLKQAAGDLTGNDELEREGERDEAAGKIKETAEKVEDSVEDAVDSLRGK